jgi:signal transduction histidine kinase/CheY-like chemotaxis protein/HAMP domain-containing protein
MRRLSIARSVRTALLGLTVVLTMIAAFGVGALYESRQDYEDELSDALSLQASAGKLLAAGVVEEATVRLTSGSGAGAARRRARNAFGLALSGARQQAMTDERSAALVEEAAAAQAGLRRQPGAGRQPLAARRALSALAARQNDRIGEARADARRSSRRAVLAITIAGALALVATLGLVATLVNRMRRPLDELVSASQRLAAGESGVRVSADGPGELEALAESFNVMAGDLETAAARLEAERRRLDVTIRSLGDALVISREDGTVVSVNPRAADLVPELRPGERMGAEADAVPPPADLEEALDHEITVQRGRRTLAVTAARMEGEDEGIVWTVRDVTERARLEQLKSEFVATASHELRSPLTSIKGFVELLSTSKGLDERQREFLEIVLVSTNRLVDLVNDLLDVARIEAGRIEIHRRPIDLVEIAHEVAALLRQRINDKRQQLTVDVADGVPRALADPSRVRQILTNLLTNAHLYSDEGGRLGIALRPSAHGVAVDVSDNGRGMSDDEIEHVFDRFYRAGDGSATPGTGLGLAIVRSLVDLHHGSIDVTSAPGEGTTFTVHLPRAVEKTIAPAEQAALHGKRVLVVDDEADIADLIAARLRPYGVETETVYRGKEALERLRAAHFDAVTLDILMPGMSGFEVLRAMRADPELCAVPVVVVSVFSGREALSGEWVVSKPIDAAELADALGAAVMAGRVRVIAVGRPESRGRVEATLEELGITYEWTEDPATAARLCASGRFEVGLVDAALPDPEAAVAALTLRGRRLRRSVVVFATGEDTSGIARLDADPVPLDDAGAVVLGLLADAAPMAG